MTDEIDVQEAEASEETDLEQPVARPRVSKLFWVALAAIVLAGAWLRLVNLGDASLRADTIVFWNLCRQPLSFGKVFSDWMKLMGITGQFPLAMAITRVFMEMAPGEASQFMLRFPSALWGIVTILFAYGLGARLGGRKMGLLLAGLLALNPYHIQVSREAYYYPPLVAGAFLYLWAAVWMVQCFARRQPRLGRGFYVVSACGFFLLTWSQPTGWPTAFLLTLLLAVFGIWHAIRHRRWLMLVGLVLPWIIIGIPLLFASWALPHLIKNASGATKQAALAALAVSKDNTFTMLFKVLTSYAWGSTLPRLLLTLVVLVAGLAVLVVFGRERKDYLVLPYILVGGFVLYLVSRYSSGAMFGTRYVLAILPAYLALLALGLLKGGEICPRLKSKPNGPKRAAIVLSALGLLMLIPPAATSTQLSGKPTPYKQIVEWTDSHLPKGTPVLVDRWFEPWNELKVYPSTNVFFTYTIPNEPVEVFLQNNWRKTAKQFFERFPTAAYLEIAKEYFEVDGVGHWQWPREYFARHVVLTNEAGLKLRNMGLASRSDFYAANTNRVVVELFYNTEEDLIERAREEGRRVMMFYGPGWRYTKTKDHRDWRLLEQSGDIHVYNMTDADLPVIMTVRGSAVGGRKRILYGTEEGRNFEFEPNRMMELKIGPAMVPPGKSILRLQDDLWELGRIPLVVEELSVRPAGPSDQG
jgi:hypothetical protein